MFALMYNILEKTTMRTYSTPLTKKEIAEMYLNCQESLTDSIRQKFIDKFCQRSDIDIIKDFNRIMNIRIRLFAPGMFQIIYE